MREVNTLWKKWGCETQDTKKKHDPQYVKLMIKKDENISVCVYCNDVSVPG